MNRTPKLTTTTTTAPATNGINSPQSSNSIDPKATINDKKSKREKGQTATVEAQKRSVSLFVTHNLLDNDDDK